MPLVRCRDFETEIIDPEKVKPPDSLQQPLTPGSRQPLNMEEITGNESKGDSLAKSLQSFSVAEMVLEAVMIHAAQPASAQELLSLKIVSNFCARVLDLRLLL